MLALDIMTTTVISVTPYTLVDAVAQMLASNHITAVPVIDAQQRVLGIVSDSDLMHRIAGWPAPHESLLRTIVERASDFTKRTRKAFGQFARDVMTTPVVTVSPQASVAEIAEILANHHVRRVPVVADGKLVGIVSRSNLVQALASRGDTISDPSERDREIRREILAGIGGPQSRASHLVNAIVCDGVVHLWGVVETAEEIEAHRVIAEAVTGVRTVKNHIVALDLVPRDVAAVV